MRIKDLALTTNVSAADYMIVDQGTAAPVTRRTTLAAALAAAGNAEVLTAVTGTDTIAGTSAQTFVAYTAGQRFQWGTTGANTGAVTLNVNSRGAKSVVKMGNQPLTGGELSAGSWVTVEYNGTAFVLLNSVEAAAANFLQAGTGAVTRTSQSKQRDIVSVLDFGGAGDWNGSTGTDNLAAITAAITYLTTIGGGVIRFPRGRYKVSARVQWTDAPITLEGEASGLQPNTGTELVFTTAGTGGINFKNGTNGKGHYSGVRNLRVTGVDTVVNGSASTGAGAGILAQAMGSRIENVDVAGFGGFGVYYLSGIGAPDVTINSNNCFAARVRVQGNYAGGWATRGVDSNACTFIKIDASSNGAWGISEGANIGNTYYSPHVDGNTTGGINLPSYGGGGAQFFGVYKETDTKPGIQIDSGNAGNHFIVCSTMDDPVSDGTAAKTSFLIWPQGGLHSSKYAIGNGTRNSWTITDLLMLCQYGFIQRFYNADNSALWSIQCRVAGDNRLEIQSAQGADFLLSGNRLSALQLVANAAATAPTGGTGVVIGGTTAATATAGAAGAPPAQVLGYIIANINGTQVKIPYYAN